MNVIAQYWERTVSGMEHCFKTDRFVTLFLAVMLVLWLGNHRVIHERANRLLVYSAGMAILLLCPITAILFVMYQSAFYDYEWLWSMVPIAGVVAYGCVIFFDKLEYKSRKHKFFWWIGFFILLFFCGNQGQIKRVDASEAEVREDAQQVIAVLKEVSQEDEVMLWASQSIMQEVRRGTGEILLVYGKDMWDLKAGAFDYEAYSQEYVQAHGWMETVTMLSVEADGQQERELYEVYEVEEQFGEVFQTMINAGVNGMVLPLSTAENLDEKVVKEAEQLQKTIERIDLDNYAIYLLK